MQWTGALRGLPSRSAMVCSSRSRRSGTPNEIVFDALAVSGIATLRLTAENYARSLSLLLQEGTPAPPSLRGRLTDTVTGAAVVGATVSVQGSSVTSSSTGHYGFDPNLTAGTFPVAVTHRCILKSCEKLRSHRTRSWISSCSRSNDRAMELLTEAQRHLCERVGVVPVQPDPTQKVGIALDTLHLEPLNGIRHPAEGDTCEWYIWGGAELSQAPDLFNCSTWHTCLSVAGALSSTSHCRRAGDSWTPLVTKTSGAIRLCSTSASDTPSAVSQTW
jgi:hypothetical protein